MERPAPVAPSLALSLIPAGALAAMLFVAVVRFEASGHIPLIAAAAIAALLAWRRLGFGWREIEHGLVESVRHALPAVFILMAVGMLIGVWIAAGVVPLLISYGLSVLSPRFFLAGACAACALISLAVGSSWSTAATAGIALIGVGQALGVPPGMTAGAVISGSYFGDKMSPLSDTTNLAAASAGVELFEHIRHMLYSTVPALALALGGFLYLGGGAAETTARLEMTQILAAAFDLTPWLLLAPAIVLGLIARRSPPLPALLAGALIGGALLLIFQPANAPRGAASVVAILYSGFESRTGVEAVDALLSRGGLTSMLETIALIICAFAFGGVMEAAGMLRRLTAALLSAVHSTSSLIVATVASGLGFNLITADQYLAVVLPGRMFGDAYRERGLHPKNLSRAIEDSATLTSPLVPWNTCGAYMASVLGVATGAYLPYAFFNLVSPLLSIAYGFTGFTIVRRREDA